MCTNVQYFASVEWPIVFNWIEVEVHLQRIQLVTMDLKIQQNSHLITQGYDKTEVYGVTNTTQERNLQHVWSTMFNYGPYTWSVAMHTVLTSTMKGYYSLHVHADLPMYIHVQYILIH